MQKNQTLPGFREFVQDPLEKQDPRTFNRIRELVSSGTITAGTLFSRILMELTGGTFSNPEAKELWRKALSHKRALEHKLGRPISIITTLADFFDLAGSDEHLVLAQSKSSRPQPATSEDTDAWVEKALVPGYHLVKLREEVMRVRRYKHALSAILLEIDDFDNLQESVITEILTLTVKIIKKTIRTVDIVARCADGRFMVILPDTNQREARELANRLRLNIRDRTKRVRGVETGIRITASVAQYGQEERSAEFVRRLETSLGSKEPSKRDTVYVA